MNGTNIFSEFHFVGFFNRFIGNFRFKNLKNLIIKYFYEFQRYFCLLFIPYNHKRYANLEILGEILLLQSKKYNVCQASSNSRINIIFCQASFYGAFFKGSELYSQQGLPNSEIPKSTKFQPFLYSHQKGGERTILLCLYFDYRLNICMKLNVHKTFILIFLFASFVFSKITMT